MKKFILFFILIGVGAYGLFRVFPAKEAPIQKEAPLFYGNVEMRTLNLGFRFLGKIVEINKDEGEAVDTNETLALLDTSKLQIALKEVEAKIDAKQAKLTKLQNGYREEDIAQAQAMLDQAKAALVDANFTYVQQTALSLKGSTSQERLVGAQAHYLMAQASLANAKATLKLKTNGYQKEDIQTQEALIRQLRASAEGIRQDINDSVLISPVKGYVLVRYKETGSIANPGENVLEVAKSDAYWITAYMDETFLGKVNVGDRVEIMTDSRKKPYYGKISFISSVAEFTPKNIETVELRSHLVYRFRVLIEDADIGIRQGMPVTLRLIS